MPEHAPPPPPASNLPPAGWYQDPHATGLQRWWDGQSWTTHAAAAPVTVNVTTAPARQDTWQPARRPPLHLEQEQLAGPGRRLVAFVADQAMLLGSLVVVSFVSAPFGDEVAAFLLLAWFVAAAIYTVVYPATCGQTLGKHLLGVQLIDTDTHRTRIGYGTVIVRELVRGLGFYPLAAGWWWALADRNNQAWHDKAASTAAVAATPRTSNVSEFLAAPFRGASQGCTTGHDHDRGHGPTDRMTQQEGKHVFDRVFRPDRPG